jgi:hypothetical protein
MPAFHLRETPFGAIRRLFARLLRLARRVSLAGLATTLLFLFLACKDQGAPEYVADEFVEAYFRRMDQRGARQFTAFGATEMLDRELELTRSVREQGYLPAEAAAQVDWKRTGRSMRGERVRFDYAIDIRREGSEEHRTADVELAKVQSGWKVVRVGVASR